MAKDKKTEQVVEAEVKETAETTEEKKVEVPADVSELVAKMVAEELAKAKAAEEAEAEAKEKAETEAEKKLREEQQKRGHEKVPCFIPYVEGEPEEVTVGFNGKLYKIKKGEEVQVPRFIYEILVNSGKQRMAAHKKQEELANVELNA